MIQASTVGSIGSVQHTHLCALARRNLAEQTSPHSQGYQPAHSRHADLRRFGSQFQPWRPIGRPPYNSATHRFTIILTTTNAQTELHSQHDAIRSLRAVP